MQHQDVVEAMTITSETQPRIPKEDGEKFGNQIQSGSWRSDPDLGTIRSTLEDEKWLIVLLISIMSTIK